MKRVFAAMFLLACGGGPAVASDCWNNVAGTQTNCAEVPAFLNGSNQTVPVSAANPLPTTNGGGGGAVTQGTIPWVDQLVSGGNMDAAGANATAPSSEFIIGGIYNVAPPTLTTGKASPLLLDANGNLQISSPSLLAAISSPLTPCTAADCSSENPVGPVLISGTLPAFTATPTFNLGTIGTAATAANQPTNNAQGAAIAGQTGNHVQAQALQTVPTYTTATTNPLAANLNGQLRVANGTSASLVTPTVTSNGAYTAGQEVGGLMTFTNTPDAATITSITVMSRSILTTGVKAYIFYANPTSTTWTDKTTPAINVLDVSKVLKAVVISTPDSSLGTHTVWEGDVNVNVTAQSFYVILVFTNAATLTSTSANDITVRATVRH